MTLIELKQGPLFPNVCEVLDESHYLGSRGRRARFVYQDDCGVGGTRPVEDFGCLMEVT